MDKKAVIDRQPDLRIIKCDTDVANAQSETKPNTFIAKVLQALSGFQRH
jgi:hypothetical protein